MMIHSRIAASIVAGLVLGATAEAAEDVVFTPNNLFVTDYVNDRVVELDRAGLLVRSFGQASLDGPEGCVFGPDGYFYVASSLNDTVIAFTPEGIEILQITHAELDGPFGLAFGPEGHLYVSSAGNDRILEFDVDRVFVRSITHAQMAGPTQIRFAPDGHLLAAMSGAAAIFEFDPAGTLVGKLGDGTFHTPLGVAFGPGGLLRVSDGFTSTIRGFDFEGDANVTASGGMISGPYQIVGGPDYSNYVACAGTNRVVEFLGTQAARELGADAGLDSPGGLAFAPFELDVLVQGKVSGGSELNEFKQKAVLYLAPGSNQLMLRFRDDKNHQNAYESIFGSRYVVYHGLEGVTAPDQRERFFQGREIYGPSYDRGGASLAIRVTGKIIGDEQYYEPRKVSGTLDRAKNYFQLQAKIATPK